MIHRKANRYLVFFINIILLFICLIIVLSILLNSRKQEKIETQVDKMTTTILRMDSAVKELRMNNELKDWLLNNLEKDLKEKDSLLAITQQVNKSLKSRLYRTKATLDEYASVLDSLQERSDIDFERTDLKNRYRSN